jgi:hypothetical protein
LTVPTALVNRGSIYGGGGGGGSVGLGVNIPVVNINLGIGAGGGGGAREGDGGSQTLPFPTWANGSPGGTGPNAAPGAGGRLVVPIPIPIGPVTVTLTPNAYGGDGGNYGQSGTSGTLFVNIQAAISVPFIGSVTILNTNLPNPPPSSFPAGGQGGNAIKRNGNALQGFADGLYNTLYMKGRIGN